MTDDVGDVHVVSVGAMRVADLAPVLVESGAEFTFVFDFASSSFVRKPDGEFILLSVLDVARAEGIDVVASDSDNFVIHTTDLAPLFAAVDHYQVRLVGIHDPSRELSSQWVAGQDVDWSTTRAVLPRFDDVAFFVDVHDDCFVHAEFFSEAVARAATARMLWFAVGTGLSEAVGEVEVRSPTPAEVDLVLGAEGRFVSSMTDTVIDNSTISLPFTRAAWRMPATIVPTHTLKYHFDGSWEVGELR
ncbi:MAG: hypothetical protein GY734_14785 [Herbaspirillum sp.]|nr:hypothetical protein [Herbaspirillum sp.]